MPIDPIFSINFLTEADLERLGTNFNRHFPITYDDLFENMIAQLDNIEATPFKGGLFLQPGLAADHACGGISINHEPSRDVKNSGDAGIDWPA